MILLPLAVCLIGAIVNLATKDKPAELGKIAFLCGLLAFLLQATSTALKGIL